MHKDRSFASFISTPENEAALLAIKDLAAGLGSDFASRANPLFLHGPAGTGKSHLISALVQEVSRKSGGAIIHVLESESISGRVPDSASPLDEARSSDLLVLEDIQHLPLRSMEPLVHLIDYRLAHELPTVFTAS